MIFEADPTSNIISNLFNERYFYNLKKLTLKLLKTNFKYQSEYFPYIILGKIFESISKKEIKLIQIINKEYERIIKNYHKNYKKITYINDIIVNNVDDCFKLVINKILKDFKTKDFILPTNKTDKNNFNFVGKNISNITKISFIKKDMYKIFLGNNSSLDINLNKNFQINYLIYEIIRQRPFPEWYYLFKN